MYESVERYLAENEYESIGEWARDSDYRMINGEDSDFWVDSEGYVVDITERIVAAIGELNASMMGGSQ